MHPPQESHQVPARKLAFILSSSSSRVLLQTLIIAQHRQHCFKHPLTRQDCFKDHFWSNFLPRGHSRPCTGYGPYRSNHSATAHRKRELTWLTPYIYNLPQHAPVVMSLLQDGWRKYTYSYLSFNVARGTSDTYGSREKPQLH